MADTDTTVEDKVKTKESTVDPIEEKARSRGWVPKEEWTNTEKPWVDAAEFMQRDSFFKKISSLKFEVSQLRDAMKVREEQHTKALEAERTAALERLKEERRVAGQEGDVDRMLTISEEMDTLREAAPPSTIVAPSTPPPEFTAWVSDNDWYVEYPNLRAEADSLGPVVAQMNPGLSYSEVLDRVGKQIKLGHPDVFAPRPPAQSNVESGRPTPPRKSAKSKKLTLDQLPDADRRVAKTLIRNGVVTEEAYLEDYAKFGG